MRFPDRAVAICSALHRQFPDLAKGVDEQRRALTRMIAEHICFELGPGWGTKRADPGRPPSKDSIAFIEHGTTRDTMWNFDWQNGDTREPNAAGEMTDITGQVFIVVQPINHLTLGPPKPPAEEPVEDDGTDVPEVPDLRLVYGLFQEVLGRLAVAYEHQSLILLEVAQLRKLVEDRRQPPAAYVGGLGLRLRLTPEE